MYVLTFPLPLFSPVGCKKGNLYNRENVLEYLLGVGRFQYHKDHYKGIDHNSHSSIICIFVFG